MSEGKFRLHVYNTPVSKIKSKKNFLLGNTVKRELIIFGPKYLIENFSRRTTTLDNFALASGRDVNR